VAHLRAAMGRLCAQRGAEVFNVCSGRAVSVLDLATLIGRLLGRTPRLEHGPARPGDIRHSRGDPAAAVAALGLVVATPLEDGLGATLRSMLDAGAGLR
jgi:UDP-glucose 4-epimerase